METQTTKSRAGRRADDRAGAAEGGEGTPWARGSGGWPRESAGLSLAPLPDPRALDWEGSMTSDDDRLVPDECGCRRDPLTGWRRLVCARARLGRRRPMMGTGGWHWLSRPRGRA